MMLAALWEPGSSGGWSILSDELDSSQHGG